MHPPGLSILLHQALESRLDRILLLTADEEWLDKVDAVHDVRVASRRLRTVLEFVDPERYPGLRTLRKRAKALTGALGATRELDVHLLKLASLGPELTDQAGHAVLEHVLETFERRRQKARRRMVRGLRRVQIQDLLRLRESEATAEDAEEADPSVVTRNLLEPMLVSTLHGVGDRVAVEDALLLHRLRIDIKKLRYAIEVLAPTLASAAEAWLVRLKALQGALGEHHDWSVLEADLWELHARLTNSRRAALAAGILDLLGIAIERRRRAFEAIPPAAAPLDTTRLAEALFLGGQPA